jgi:mono/diheme cytochrome c family protein
MSPLYTVLRNRRLVALTVIAILVLAACSGGAVPAAGTATPGTASFSKDVMPILQSRCVNCHGGRRTQKGLDMTSYANLMAGSENGSVVTPGDPDHSSFIQMIVQGKMPKTGPKLLPAQVQLLAAWVQAGALNN